MKKSNLNISIKNGILTIHKGAVVETSHCLWIASDNVNLKIPANATLFYVVITENPLFKTCDAIIVDEIGDRETPIASIIFDGVFYTVKK